MSEKSFEEKIDDAVHAAMKALGLNVEDNMGHAEGLNDFLTEEFQAHFQPDEPDLPQERKTYTVSITRDASVTYTKTFEGTLEELMARVSRHGFADDDERDWEEDDPSVFDQVESAEILDGDESLASYDQEMGWSVT